MCFLCHPPKTVGKDLRGLGWTGLPAWLNAGRILRLLQSFRRQPTTCHLPDIDQYLIRLAPGMILHALCTTHARVHEALLYIHPH